MLYPMYIRRNANGTYRVTFPDFDSCFSDLRRQAYLSSNFLKSVENHLQENNIKPGLPSKPESWFSDVRFQGGYWLLAHIDTRRLTALQALA